MRDNYKYVIDKGAVRKIKEVELSIVPLSDYLHKLQEQAPKTIVTPPLPIDCTRYTRVPHGGTFFEIFTVFSKPRIETIAWRPKSTPDAPPTNYVVSWPGILFKFVFGADGLMLDPRMTICSNRPSRDQERLYLPSLPNVWDDGKICMTPQCVPGDFASSCNNTVQTFFTGQAFNDDLKRWPSGVTNFNKWQEKTAADPAWIEKCKWTFLMTFGEWSKIWDK
jgi:hypothetical protein